MMSYYLSSLPSLKPTCSHQKMDGWKKIRLPFLGMYVSLSNQPETSHLQKEDITIFNRRFRYIFIPCFSFSSHRHSFLFRRWDDFPARPGDLTYPPPEIADLMIRAYENHWFPFIRPAIKPLFFWGGYVRGGWLTSHDQLGLSNLQLQS